jgi:hypothetical protein
MRSDYAQCPLTHAVEQHSAPVLHEELRGLQVPAWAGIGAVIETTSGKARAVPTAIFLITSRRDSLGRNAAHETLSSSK